MKLTIQRGPSRPEGTFGTATLDDGDGTSYDSIELPWRDNLQGKSSIQIGTYHAVLVMSPHFGYKVYQLQGVPGRTFIEIHPGNWGGDVDAGLYSDLMGCIALGFGTGLLQPPDSDFAPQKAVLRSRAAFADFMLRAATSTNGLDVQIIAFDSPDPPARDGA